MTTPNPMTSQMWRLLLAHCADDQHAEQLVAAEFGSKDWKSIADGLLDVAAVLLADRNGAGIRFVERQIDLTIYCEDRDRRDLPLDIGIIDRQMAIWDAYEQEKAFAT